MKKREKLTSLSLSLKTAFVVALRTKALVTHSSLQGGSSHVVLADADSLPTITSSRIDGSVQAAEEPWEGICMTTNTFVEPSKPVELPAEEGCFKFEPVWYQRKQ